MAKTFSLLFFLICLIGCNQEETSPNGKNKLYFPPTTSADWENVTPQSLNWDSEAINELYDFLSQNGTRAFIVLKDGKIVLEKYWGNDLIQNRPFDQNSNWYWASAGKTLTAFLVGIAQSEGVLDINDKTSKYLGINWTSLPAAKEDLILIRHQLTMSTGLDYDIPNQDCTDPACLKYKKDAGSQWYYHNAPYTLLEKVVSNASGMTFNEYTDRKIESQIGMNGTWIQIGENNVYWSNSRSAARFGLLLLNHGIWDQTAVLSDRKYWEELTQSSQNLNPSYGYLTWLNGKSSIIFPGLPNSIQVPLSSEAPSDLFSAMGKNGQFINVVPSEGMVVIRMGEAPENALVPIKFHNDMWKKIKAVKN